MGGLALTDLLLRSMSLGALVHGPRDRSRVALTFDDGPSERTAALLEVLARHRARATFFVLRGAAEGHPERMRALEQSGHQVESHGVVHRHALLLPPWTERAQLAWHPARSRGGLYRPPHGGHSPLTRLFAAAYGRRVAMWDLEGQDWLDRDPRALAERILRYVQPGSVILLHDGPARTLPLLEVLLPGLEQRGLEPVTLEELGAGPQGWAGGVRRALQGLPEMLGRHRST
nr:polysaccharide deacetylase family protein [Deinobacterium chartae]